jgi:molybdopterin-guanine dinucleotide biosynthesis protein A
MVETSFDPDLITAAILAGGEGSRMQGRDKGFVELAGRPLVAHVVEALRGQANTLLICANRNAEEYACFGTVVADAVPGFRGPLAGIAAALVRCSTPWLLTVPVDAPRLPHDLARQLFAAATAESADAAIVLENVKPQPMFALYRNRLAEAAATALAQDLPVWRWQQQMRAAEVFFDADDNAFVNLNTDEDVTAWERAHAQG